MCGVSPRGAHLVPLLSLANGRGCLEGRRLAGSLTERNLFSVFVRKATNESANSKRLLSKDCRFRERYTLLKVLGKTTNPDGEFCPTLVTGNASTSSPLAAASQISGGR